MAKWLSKLWLYISLGAGIAGYRYVWERTHSEWYSWGTLAVVTFLVVPSIFYVLTGGRFFMDGSRTDGR